MKEAHSIVIGEGGEYGRRLVRYMESRIPPSVRIYHYTSPEAMASMKESADYYLLDRAFAEAADKKGIINRKEEAGRILLSDTPAEGEEYFLRTEPPGRLLSRMGFPAEKDIGGEDNKLSKCRITAVYSPVYENDIMKIAMTFMEEGDLYLGFEDLGPADGHEANVGDLCYYIHIRDEHIVDTMEDLCHHVSGIFRLDSPSLFFCLKELDGEDYHWFFDSLRLSRRYAGVYLGVGNSFLSDTDRFALFDRIILIDSVERARQHAFCARFKQALLSDSIDFRGEIREYLREDFRPAAPSRGQEGR